MKCSTAWLVVSFLTVVSSGQCPKDVEKRKLIEGMLVKDNPIHLMQGFQFSNVWVKKYLKDFCECSSDKYIKKEDGSSEVTSVFKPHNGKPITGSPETVKETDKAGLFSLSGVYDTTKAQYTGSSYIIYADNHALAYYACEDDDSKWNMGVQVRSEERTGLATMADNEGKHSLEKARQTMAEAAKIFDLEVGDDIVMYDLENLC